ncbi:hypothetical protein FC72_GL000865 [Companilactobacillus tucceti DSM 20183]|uniref:DAGKc domain-containing protein n=1 Tax=Companilactobacillus tucceti DSM 20183 TaxID=1423811 RepID=A0A0R1JAT4_9LACO|nr:diacylglycerol kinase family protein [Companilactobacillus tucceti]KRK65396.1 hypothetical protein FC72_GL000865 [Companilactobacillus tucceti DSM 20183]
MTKIKKLEIILNRKAGNGESVRVWKSIKMFLKKNQIDFQIHSTQKNGDGIRIAKNLADKIDKQTKILVLGGDGTLNQSVNGVKLSKNPNTPLAYIPAGSGNDFSRGIKLNHVKPIVLLQDILSMQEPRSIDIGKATFSDKTKYFVNNIGIGFDANTVYTTNHSKRKDLLNKMKLGTLAYVSSLIKVIKEQGAFPLTVTTKHGMKKFDQAYIVSATNHPYFGGGIAIDPLATPFDGKLDLVVVNKIKGKTFIKLFTKLLTDGSHLKDENVWHIQSSEFTLSSLHNEYGQMDGEELKPQEFDINFEVSSHPFWLPVEK